MFSPENAGERSESKTPGAQGTRQYIKYGEGITRKGHVHPRYDVTRQVGCHGTAQRRYRTAQQVCWVKP